MGRRRGEVAVTGLPASENKAEILLPLRPER